MNERLSKWKIDKLRWFSNCFRTFIEYIIIPMICYGMLDSWKIAVIDADTFYSVFVTIFVIRLFFCSINPPKYQMVIKKGEEEKEP